MRRYRLLVWLDAAHNPVQAAIATYAGDDKLTESTWSCEPFDNLADVCNVALHTVAKQLTLF